MINQFKVGCNFDMELIDKAVELNEKYSGKAVVKEWFGSDAAHADVAARPPWRLQDISMEYLEKFVKKSLEHGIVFNYTMNSISPYNTKPDLLAHKKDIQDFAKQLESIGVYRITFANPMIAMMIREVSNIELEASCILHIDAVTQMKYLHETLGVNKFCNSILKNRSKVFLKNAAQYCNDNGLILELLGNEFCYNNGKSADGTNYAAPCIYRDSCYICHATCKTKEDSMCFNNYPMQFCMGSRNGNEEGWLRSRWIRPEDLHYYNDIGINYFKVSGRTGKTSYIASVMEAYMKGSWEGNSLGLWKPLETIASGESELDHKFQDFIDNKKLDGFLDHWFKPEGGFECNDQLCGTTCTYCHDFYQKMNGIKDAING